MSEIEVVINITKHEWEYLNKLVKNGDQLGHYERLLVNGIPLPEGHGRLVDADAINLKDISPVDGFSVYGATAEDIDLTPTVLEADEVES